MPQDAPVEEKRERINMKSSGQEAEHNGPRHEATVVRVTEV